MPSPVYVLLITPNFRSYIYSLSYKPPLEIGSCQRSEEGNNATAATEKVGYVLVTSALQLLAHLSQRHKRNRYSE